MTNVSDDAVSLPDGLEVWWDGQSRVYIDAEASFFGNTQVRVWRLADDWRLCC